jgi:hypothetical protein
VRRCPAAKGLRHPLKLLWGGASIRILDIYNVYLSIIKIENIIISIQQLRDTGFDDLWEQVSAKSSELKLKKLNELRIKNLLRNYLKMKDIHFHQLEKIQNYILHNHH